MQLAARLGLPSVNGATKIEAGSGSVTVERTLEDVVEVVEVPLPAVVSVAPGVAGADGAYESALEVLSCKAPEQAERKLEVMDASEDGAIEKFAAALKAAL